MYGDYDQASMVYEFVPEATKIVGEYSVNAGMTREDIESLVNTIMSKSLNHDYPSQSFLSVADFIIARHKHFKEMSQI